MFRTAVLTISDRSYEGVREDKSGPAIRDALEGSSYRVVYSAVIPDERNVIRDELKRLCDGGETDLILTTGGTGFAERDVTPEATRDVAQKDVPGVAEAIRSLSAKYTNRAMLSRGVSVIRGRTLIVNLPGSPKAVRECLEFLTEPLEHGLDILLGTGTD